MSNSKQLTYYAEWDKCVCKGKTYTVVLIPSKKVCFLIYKPKYSIEQELWSTGIRYNIGLNRNRDIHLDIGEQQLMSIVSKEGLFLPDDDINVISFPLRLVQNYLT